MIKPKKELGQNFLSDQPAIKQMVHALDIKDNETIIEIGPGLGVVTQEILNSMEKAPSSKLICIEYDSRLIPQLKAKFGKYPQFSVVNESILDWLPKLRRTDDILGTIKIIGSLPYYITSPIFHETIRLKTMPQKCVFLIQKEVAQKIYAQVPDASYLSTFVQTFYEVEWIKTVDKKMFYPVPQVDGGIISLTLKKEQKIEDKLKQKYEGFLHRGFSSPRKMLNKVFPKEFLENTHIDPNLRPQNLTPETWVNMFTFQLSQ
jgi:16S rRNA (adenine1518-N6/adenine1519-N6)-dimethyltransferase